VKPMKNNSIRKPSGPLRITLRQNQLASLIQQGLAFHQQGKFKEAQALYEQILAFQPNHFDILQLLGTLSAQTKQFTKAVEYLSRAIKLNPKDAECYYNRGNVLQELRRFEESLNSYDHAIELKENFAECYYNRGSVLQELQRFDEALISYDKAILFRSDYSKAYNSRGNILKIQNCFNESLISYSKAIQLNPTFVEAFINRGNVLQELGRIDEALVNFDQAIQIADSDEVAYYNRGNVLRILGRLDEALLSYNKALSLKPNFTQAYINRGNLLQEMQRFYEAILSYDHAIRINPNSSNAYTNRGNALKELNLLEESIASHKKAIVFKPDSAEAYYNLATVLQKNNRLDEALIYYDKAISIKSNYAEAYNNSGIVLQENNSLDEALLYYDNALRSKSDFPEANFNLAILKLLTGNFKDGWRGYEWRWEKENLSNHNTTIRDFLKPLWLGIESIKDKTIFLHAEQGLGDTIQFCRYAPLVNQLGAKVILEVQRPLIKLLNNIVGVSQIIAFGDDLPDFDYHCPLLSLPLAFNTEIHSIPPVTKFYSGDIEKVTKWQAQLGRQIKPRVGIVWSGSPDHKNDHNRSIELFKILPHIPKHIEFICLQKEIRDLDKELLAEHSEIKYFGNAIEDFTDTATLCEMMDLVITVDTSVAHLSGLLGKQTWLLIPFNPDWRWLLNREDSPWYPSIKLYRQQKTGEWDSVLGKINDDLRRFSIGRFANN
jgi:tetratricopeptide (TPR) repeat protein